MKKLVVFGLLWACVSAEVMVHLFEWRYDDIAKECVRFLAPYGYDAVQISPVTENAIIKNRPWHERYQPTSYRLITRSGNEEDFRKMVYTCNNVGVKIYVDVVLNHMTGALPKGSKSTGGSEPDTENKIYPEVLYGPEHFHNTCRIENWNDANQIRSCELLGLHDLDQSLPYVQSKMVEFLNKLVDIGVAGFRVDAAKHMHPDDLRSIYNQVNNLNTRWFPVNSRPYYFHEVTQIVQKPGEDVIKPNEYLQLGGAVDFKYSWEVSRGFTGNNPLKYYQNFGVDWKILSWSDSIDFVDSHDTQRYGNGGLYLNYKQSKQYKMAVAFMLGWPHGRARVMSSFPFENIDQGPPTEGDMLAHVAVNPDLTCGPDRVCEHRWRQIYNMVRFAKVVGDAPVDKWWSNGRNQIAFARTNKGFIVFNGENTDLNVDLQTTLPPGTYCDLATGLKIYNEECSGKTVMVRADGMASISLAGGEEDGFLAISIDLSFPVNTLHLIRRKKKHPDHHQQQPDVQPQDQQHNPETKPHDQTQQPETEPQDQNDQPQGQQQQPHVEPQDQQHNPKAEPQDPKDQPQDQQQLPDVEPQDQQHNPETKPHNQTQQPETEPQDPKDQPQDQQQQPDVEPQDQQHNPEAEPQDPKDQPQGQQQQPDVEPQDQQHNPEAETQDPKDQPQDQQQQPDVEPQDQQHNPEAETQDPKDQPQDQQQQPDVEQQDQQHNPQAEPQDPKDQPQGQQQQPHVEPQDQQHNPEAEPQDPKDQPQDQQQQPDVEPQDQQHNPEAEPQDQTQPETEPQNPKDQPQDQQQQPAVNPQKTGVMSSLIKKIKRVFAKIWKFINSIFIKKLYVPSQ